MEFFKIIIMVGIVGSGKCKFYFELQMLAEMFLKTMFYDMLQMVSIK